jgi:hypothetical protein
MSSLPQRLHLAAQQLDEPGLVQSDLRDARLVGCDGEVECDVCIGDDMRSIRVRWLADVGTLEVVDPLNDAYEAWLHADGDAPDLVERMHSEFVAAHRAWRGGRWVMP